jgi:hypothetical protein
MSADPQQAIQTSGTPPHGTLSAERLREVLQRLEAKFYDRPDVRNRIARALSNDLGSSPNTSVPKP